MFLYLDSLGAGGAYRASSAAASLTFNPRTQLYALPRHVEALGYRPRRASARLFHIERMRFLPAGRIGSSVGELHCVVIVDCVDPLLSDPSTIRMLWEITGGAQRRSPLHCPSSVRAPAGGVP